MKNFKQKLYRRVFLTAILSHPFLISFGQTFVKGSITDGLQGLPSATVLLLTQDSALVKGSITDVSGHFTFDNILPGSYLLSASMVGYTKHTSMLVVEERNILLPEIILKEEATALGEVVIKAERPMFEQHVDKLVMNVQSSITSSGNTVLELIQKSPGVVVNKQGGGISLNGKSGVRIMINGKLMQLPLDVVLQMLDGMSSSNIEKIEFITTPPSKYDAEGQGGIIHIVTKENADLGTNGIVGATVGARWAETTGGNFSLNHRANKIGFVLDYSILRNHNLHKVKTVSESFHNEYLQRIDNHSVRENITTVQNLNSGLEWNINKNTLLTLGITAYRRNWDMTAVTTENNYAANDSTVFTIMNVAEVNRWQSATGAIGLQTKMSDKSEVSVNLDYLYYHNNNPSTYDTKLHYKESNAEEASTIALKKNTPIHIIVGRGDYQYQYSPSLTFETGFKAVRTRLDNNVLVERLLNNNWTTDPLFTSYSTLNEQILAGYGSLKWNVGAWQLNNGIRYEYTHTAISTPTQKNVVNRKYGYWFPGFSIRKELDREKDLQFSYSKRITRPTYNDMAPFVFFWGTNTFSAGNTSLWPAISDAIKVGYHDKQWIISAQFSHTKNDIAFFQAEKDNESGNVIYRSQNIDFVNAIALTNSYHLSITPQWEVQGSVTTQYQVARPLHLQRNKSIELYGINLNVISVVKLPRQFSIEISGFYQSKSLWGVSYILPVSSLNAGIQKKFGDKSSLTLSMDDILYTNITNLKTSMPDDNLNVRFNYDWHNQFVRVTFTRNFGSNKLKSVKVRSGSEEERKRLTN